MDIRIVLITVITAIPVLIMMYYIWKMDKQANPKHIKSR